MERTVPPSWQAHGRHRSAAALAADRAYLNALAKRLAHDARLPLPLAQRRVQRLAVSARPRALNREGGQ